MQWSGESERQAGQGLGEIGRSVQRRRIGSDDPIGPLSQLIHLLQGGDNPVITDAGIAARNSADLDAIAGKATLEAEVCGERVDLLLGLLDHCLEHQCRPKPDTLMEISYQVRQLMRDHWRWRELAENAAYYRNNKAVAECVASLMDP